VARYAESARTIGGRVAGPPDSTGTQLEGVRPAYRQLFEIARKDMSYRVRLAVAQELGDGGDAAFETLSGLMEPTDGAGPESWLSPPGARFDWPNEDTLREFSLRAWLAPMLAGSTVRHSEEAHANLVAWHEYAAHQPAVANDRCPLSLQVALAQGFKLAANRRPDHPSSTPAARASLAELAADLLETSRFWYSRVALLQALCLWALAEMPAWQGRERRRGAADRHRRSKKTPALPAGRGANPRALVEHWLETQGGGPEHPFVSEAGELAILALEQRQPERFIWIDESGVATKIGAPAAGPQAVRKYNLWIPPSVGWSALHPRAQKLVADMLLFLNLIERNDRPAERERRMRRAVRDTLPPCLTGERDNLDPSRTVGLTVESTPGINCKDDCPFDFCPYPPKGTQPYRVELSEAFCRRQQVLLGKWWRPVPRPTASWQGAAPAELRRFWKEMEERVEERARR
jgi:hypothetical protein